MTSASVTRGSHFVENRARRLQSSGSEIGTRCTRVHVPAVEERYVLLAILYIHSVASVRRLALVYNGVAVGGRERDWMSNIVVPLGVPLVALYMQPVRVYKES